MYFNIQNIVISVIKTILFLIDDNPNHYQVNNGNNIIAIQPWNYKVWCDDKLEILMNWLIKHHNKNLGKCKLPNLLDRTLPEMYGFGKGNVKINTQILENHCQNKVKSKKVNKKTKSLLSSIKSKKIANKLSKDKNTKKTKTKALK